MRLGLLAATWLGGILLGLSSGLETAAALLLAGAGGLAAVSLWLARLPAVPAVVAAVLVLGMARAEASDPGHSGAAALDGREVTATGRIANDPESTATRVRFELLLSEIRVDGDALEADERWLVYAQPSGGLVARRDAPYFRYGDILTVVGSGTGAPSLRRLRLSRLPCSTGHHGDDVRAGSAGCRRGRSAVAGRNIRCPQSAGR